MTQLLRPTAEQALAAWRSYVEADADQVSRLRDDVPGGDYYGPVAARFRAGARAVPEFEVLSELARPDDTWLDIGAGGGRLAVPLAGSVAHVVAVEPSAAMRGQLGAAVATAGLANIEVRDVRWPDADWTDTVDVSLAAHCLYDIADIEPFLEAMERHSRRRCVALFRPWARGTSLAGLFEAVHGEPMHTLPALRDFVALLAARGCRYEVRTVDASGESPVTAPDLAFAEARRLLWLADGSPKDQRMRDLMAEWWSTADGIALPPAPAYIGVVSWLPRLR